MRPTREQILKYLDVNLDTGILTWDDHWRRTDLIGRQAGSISHGYIKIKLYGIHIFVHHVIWFIAHDKWPEMPLCIDHIDGDPRNNALSNLRLCTYAQNHANSGHNTYNTSGYKGVTYAPKYIDPWIAKIEVDGTTHYLGSFPTPEEAHVVWYKAACEAWGAEFVKV